MHDRNNLLGWCRSIHVDGDLAWVGFSRIRATKFRENVGWVAHGLRRVCPTHMALYDLARNECLAEVDLETAGLSAVFSILPETGRVRAPGSLSAAIADRLGFVAGSVRDVLRAAALLGTDFAVPDLAIVLGSGWVPAIDAL